MGTDENGKIVNFPLKKRISAQLRAYSLRVYLVRGPFGEELVGQKIFRTLKIRSDQTLEDLHHAILCAYEREHDRSYEFYFGRDPYDPIDSQHICREEGLNLGQTASADLGQRSAISPQTPLKALKLSEDRLFSYWFDLTEQWLHLVHVLSIDPVDPSEDYPRLIERRGELPTSIFTLLDKKESETRQLDDLLEEEMLVTLVGELQIQWRQQLEDQPLRPQTELKIALNKIPAHWLEAIAHQSGLDLRCTRKERIKRLCKHLLLKDTLVDIWRRLPLSSREMLSWILIEKNGWAKIQSLSRRYRPDPDLSWWWNEGQIPESPLGLLRFHGLVYIGKTREDKRRVRIAVIPVELRQPLQDIINNREYLDDLPALATPGQSSFSLSAQEILANARSSPSFNQKLWQGLNSLNLKSFLAVCPYREDTESFYIYMLGRMRRNPKAFTKKDIREFLQRIIHGSSEWNRLAAYKFGMTIFNERFLEPALYDNSKAIQLWAQRVMKNPQERLF